MPTRRLYSSLYFPVLKALTGVDVLGLWKRAWVSRRMRQTIPFTIAMMLVLTVGEVKLDCSNESRQLKGIGLRQVPMVKRMRGDV